MNEPLALKKQKALARMLLSQQSLRRAMTTGQASGASHVGSGITLMLLTWLAPRVIKPIMGLFEGEPIADTVHALLNTVELQFKKSLGPLIDQHPFLSVLVAATAGALMVKYRRAIADFLVKHMVP